MIVVFIGEAEADHKRIGDHIARDNPQRFVSFIGFECCKRLAETRQKFSLVLRYRPVCRAE